MARRSRRGQRTAAFLLTVRTLRVVTPEANALEAQPESGFLGHISSLNVIVQYWRSFSHLEAYARSKDHEHWPAWVAFNKRVGNSRGDVGIWHETYQVRAGQYETFYSGMPPFGLGKAGRLAPTSGLRDSARGRITGEPQAVRSEVL